MATEFGISRRNLAKLVGAGILGGLVGNVPDRKKSHSLWYNGSMSDLGVEVSKVGGVEIVSAGKEGPNIIFLHNAGQVPEGMTEHIGNLAEAGQVQVVAPNIFDIIRSLQLKGNANPSFADIAYEIFHLDILNKKEKTGIVSSSFGGSVAWEYTLQHPQEVEWNVAGSPTGWPLKRSLVEWMGAFVREFLLPPRVPIPEDLRKRDPGSGLMVKRSIADLRSVLHGLKITMAVDQREQMQDINQPVDLLWGRDDRYIPSWTGEKMLGLFPNARLTIVSEYNHLWMAVEPEKLTGPAIQRIQASTAR
ncbi:alpha/beta hydrolase [Candidatus Daviesbacteria bacterium]|nr:alpha/beta hydrolase [Candidatus Daviesbacteria bacterium]